MVDFREPLAITANPGGGTAGPVLSWPSEIGCSYTLLPAGPDLENPPGWNDLGTWAGTGELMSFLPDPEVLPGGIWFFRVVESVNSGG